MKAAICDRPNEMGIREIESRDLQGRDVLLKTMKAAVCTTDIKIFTGIKKAQHIEFPIVLGHEIAGEVVDTGPEHETFQVGDQLIPYPSVSCGNCDFCLAGKQNLCQSMDVLGYNYHGGFAEYVWIPGEMFNNSRGRVHRIPEGLDVSTATLFEPISCAFNGVKQSKINEGDTVLIVGLGFMGLVMVHLVQLFGSVQVIGSDPIPERREKARVFGADDVVDPTEEDAEERIRDLTGGGADAVIAALGSPDVFEDSLKYVRAGGSLNLFGGAPHGSSITLDPNEIHYREIDLVGTFGYHIPDSGRVLNILRRDSIPTEELLSEYRLDEVPQAIQDAADNKIIKGIVSFD